MTRTILEMYIDILKTLSQNNPLKNTDVTCETKINDNKLKKYIDFLFTQGLINRESARNNRTVYSITHKGITVLNFFKKQKQIFLIPTKKDPL